MRSNALTLSYPMVQGRYREELFIEVGCATLFFSGFSIAQGMQKKSNVGDFIVLNSNKHKYLKITMHY